MSALVYTIDSDAEIDPESQSDDEEQNQNGFSFAFDDGEKLHPVQKRTKEKVNSNIKGDFDNVRSMPHADERAERVREKSKKDTGSVNKGMDSATEGQYFDSVLEEDSNVDVTMFSELNLSRPILRAIEASGYVSPTPVQAKVIPVALAGRDICASAVTGSGKTAAFVLPFLERLLFRPKDVATIRVLVVTPTRELANQIYSVLLKLAQHTDVTCLLVCGGKKDVKSQEAALRLRPDVVVCTPGRIIDHLRNSHSVDVADLDVLVLDEVDRLLDLGFQDEVKEIIRHCPQDRQTMLFSATMTSGVDELAQLSLKRPVRIKTFGDTTTVAPRLIQEFVKVRHEDEREAMVASLVCRGFNKKTMVFCETKKEAHRCCMVLSQLIGADKVCELHGDLPQVKRDTSLYNFKQGLVDVMVATDVAARGLDVSGVLTVINTEMPRNTSTYVHRVGRTARAGRGGRSITLVSDGRRRVMKELLKGDGAAMNPDEEGGANKAVLSRTIPSEVVSQYSIKIASLESTIKRVMEEERMRTRMDDVAREVDRAQNLVLHEDEIASRPARSWHQSVEQKKQIKEASIARAVEESEIARVGVTSHLEKVRNQEVRLDETERAKQLKKESGMSRLKRRRMLEQQEEPDDARILSAPKRAKTAEREKSKLYLERIAGDTGPKFAKPKNKKDASIETKAKRPIFATGGLDQDMYSWSGGGSGMKTLSKKKEKLSKEKEFSDFDPTKRLRKGGKIGHSSFKSKSKFKRRR